MKKTWILLGLIQLTASTIIYANQSIEGYWRSMDDRTGEPLSIIEFKKAANGTYTGTIVHRYKTIRGVRLDTCAKCPEPFKDKPLLGLQIIWDLKNDPNKPNNYINGKLVEPRTGNIYNGRGNLTSDGRKLYMRGYMGVSMLGRTQVWLRINDFNAEINP